MQYIPCGQTKGNVGDFLDDVLQGHVVVIDNGGRQYCTVWGDIMSQVAEWKVLPVRSSTGYAGMKTIQDLKYPIFTKGNYMMTGKDRVEVASLTNRFRFHRSRSAPVI